MRYKFCKQIQSKTIFDSLSFYVNALENTTMQPNVWIWMNNNWKITGGKKMSIWIGVIDVKIRSFSCNVTREQQNKSITGKRQIQNDEQTHNKFTGGKNQQHQT